MAKIPIILEPGRADGKLTESQAIYDSILKQFQSDINGEYKLTKEQVEFLTPIIERLNDVQDTLTSIDADKPLSAQQGKILKELLDAKVIETGAVPMDSEPTEGNTEHVVTSDGINKALNKKVDINTFVEKNKNQDEKLSELALNNEGISYDITKIKKGYYNSTTDINNPKPTDNFGYCLVKVDKNDTVEIKTYSNAKSVLPIVLFNTEGLFIKMSGKVNEVLEQTYIVEDGVGYIAIQSAINYNDFFILHKSGLIRDFENSKKEILTISNCVKNNNESIEILSASVDGTIFHSERLTTRGFYKVGDKIGSPSYSDNLNTCTIPVKAGSKLSVITKGVADAHPIALFDKDGNCTKVLGSTGAIFDTQYTVEDNIYYVGFNCYKDSFDSFSVSIKSKFEAINEKINALAKKNLVCDESYSEKISFIDTFKLFVSEQAKDDEYYLKGIDADGVGKKVFIYNKTRNVNISVTLFNNDMAESCKGYKTFNIRKSYDNTSIYDNSLFVNSYHLYIKLDTTKNFFDYSASNVRINTIPVTDISYNSYRYKRNHRSMIGAIWCGLWTGEPDSKRVSGKMKEIYSFVTNEDTFNTAYEKSALYDSRYPKWNDYVKNVDGEEPVSDSSFTLYHPETVTSEVVKSRKPKFPLEYGGHEGFRMDTQGVIDEQLRMARDKGIDFFNFCLFPCNETKICGEEYTDKDFEDRPQNKDILLYVNSDVENKPKFMLTITFDSTPTTPDQWRKFNALLEYAKRKYLNNENYIEIDGEKPILLYGVSIKLPKEYGIRYYYNIGSNRISFAEGCYSYAGHLYQDKNTYPYNHYPYKNLAEYNASRYQTRVAEFDDFHEIVPVVIGRDPRPRTNYVMGTDGTYNYEQPTRQEWKDALQTAVEQASTNINKDSVLMIYAWNEIAEGGWLLPTVSDIEEPMWRLNVVKEVKDNWLTICPNPLG